MNSDQGATWKCCLIPKRLDRFGDRSFTNPAALAMPECNPSAAIRYRPWMLPPFEQDATKPLSVSVTELTDASTKTTPSSSERDLRLP